MNNNIPLNLSINQEEFLYFIKRNNDPNFVELRDKIFQRDNYICRYCGFQAGQHMFVANINQKYGYSENTLDNMVTACPFCVQCHFLAEVGLSFGGGFLIVLPGISQNVLNSYCHVLFCAIKNNRGLSSSSLYFYKLLRSRERIIDEQLILGASNPSIFNNMMVEWEEGQKFHKTEWARDIKLLPSLGAFDKELYEWMEESLKQLKY